MILKAKWWVDRQLNIHENASVDTGGEARIVDLKDSILMPGLVNSHCHLDYTDMRGMIPQQESFTAWIQQINQLKNSWGLDDFNRSIEHGLRESLSFGTTAMVNWICHPETFENLIPCSQRIWWLWEQIAFRPDSPEKIWDDWPKRVSSKSALWKAGVAPHAPYTCRMEVIQKACQWSSAHSLPWSIHVAESQEEFDMLRHGKGHLFNLFRKLGRDVSDCGKTTPLGNLEETLIESSVPVLIIHANFLEPMDSKSLKYLMFESLLVPQKTARRISIIHCPRSYRWFSYTSFPLATFKKLQINLALGTDSLASNQDLSMFEEMNCMAQAWPELDHLEIVRMATVNGAWALGVENQWNQWQDWIAIPEAPPESKDLWKIITHFTGKPHFVMVNGEIVISELI